jgi:hypothetical protein
MNKRFAANRLVVSVIPQTNAEENAVKEVN